MAASDNDDSYLKLLSAIRERNGYDVLYREALEEVRAKVDISWVKSGLAFGTGRGDHEIELVRRLMPNLKTFTAVEPDQASANALRASFRNGQLPGVDTEVIETSVEQWRGDDCSVDAVLLLNVLLHIDAADRQAFFHLLSTCLRPNSIVVIIVERDIPTAGFVRLTERLGHPLKTLYDDAEKDMLEAGFSVVLTHDIKGTDDLSNPSDDLVKFIQLMTNNEASESQVRDAIADIFQQPSNYIKTFAIFKK